MTTEKNIPVNFVQYTQHENHPDHIACLGHINLKELQDLMTVFTTPVVAPNACICSLSLSYSQKTNFGRTAIGNKHNRVLDIDGMFYYNQYPQCGKQNCPLNEEDKTKRCARNLRNGKCQDEFIRNTLGAVLFPEHYAKDKQK